MQLLFRFIVGGLIVLLRRAWWRSQTKSFAGSERRRCRPTHLGHFSAAYTKPAPTRDTPNPPDPSAEDRLDLPDRPCEVLCYQRLV